MGTECRVEEKKPISQLAGRYETAGKNLRSKLQMLSTECDYFRDIGEDGGSFWVSYLVHMGDLLDKAQLNFNRLENIIQMDFNKLKDLSETYSFLLPDIQDTLNNMKNLGKFDITGANTDSFAMLASWLKQATIGYVLMFEDRFNRWLTRDNFRNNLIKQLNNLSMHPDETLLGAFAELFQVNLRIYPLDNSPVEEHISFGYKGAAEHAGKEADFIILQEDGANNGYKYKLLYQDADTLRRLDYNLVDTRVSFNGMSSVTGPSASTGCDVVCASKAPGTTTDEDLRPLVSDKEPIENVLAEYNMVDSPQYYVKMSDIAKRYKYVRRTRGDGACYWRCLLISIAEKCTTDPSYLQKIRDLCVDYLERMPDLGFESLVIEDFIQTFQEEMLDKIANGQAKQAFDSISDHNHHMYFVSFVKLITSGYIMSQGDEYLINAQADGFTTLREYVDQRVQVMETPADDVAICASLKVFDLNTRVEYVSRDDRPMSQKGSYYLLPYDDEKAEYNVFLLWRPEHYDLLYKA